MPFNYGTPGWADPRLVNTPRLVGGRLATWQANPGQMIDYQLGTPLAQRFATAAPTQNMVYGDSYGGVQAAEQNEVNAANALMMQRLQMQQAAYDKAQQRAIDAERYRNANMYQLERNLIDDRRNANTDAYNMKRLDRQDIAQENRLNIADQVSADKRYGVDQATERASGVDLSKLKLEGQGLAADLDSVFSEINELAPRVANDKILKDRFRQAMVGVGDSIKRNEVGTYYPVQPDDTTSVKYANIATAYIEQAAEAADRIRRLVSLQDSLPEVEANVRARGWKLDPANGRVTHPEAGLKYRFGSATVPVVSPAPEAPVTGPDWSNWPQAVRPRLDRLAYPAQPTPITSRAQVGPPPMLNYDARTKLWAQ